MWRVVYSRQFEKAARNLDKAVLKRVVKYLDQLEDLEDPRVRGKALTGDLAGYWRYRIGDYRVLAEIDDGELVIIAIAVAHRGDVYR